MQFSLLVLTHLKCWSIDFAFHSTFISEGEGEAEGEDSQENSEEEDENEQSEQSEQPYDPVGNDDKEKSNENEGEESESEDSVKAGVVKQDAQPVAAANDDEELDYYEQQLHTLYEMFPENDKTLVNDIYRANGGDMNQTSQQLLMMQDDNNNKNNEEAKTNQQPNETNQSKLLILM